MADPEISVVIASHDRPLRLRWLLNALEEQTLPRDSWEVVVGHDSSGPETSELLRNHPLAAAGILFEAIRPPGSAPPGANRNAALEVARGRLIVFTDDDCRPPPEWLEDVVAAAERHPGRIVQGITVWDPDEEAITHATYRHTVTVRHPPTPWAECTNMIYPRHWIDAVGGFDEHQMTGEDTDLNQRCQQAGAEYVGDRGFTTYHCVVETSLLKLLLGRWRWKDLPYLIKKHPAMRRHFPMWIFWKRTHVWFPFFLLGLWGMRHRTLLYGLLCVPYTVHALPAHGTNPRGRYRNISELPYRVALDAVEIAALTRGSVKYRTFFI